MTIKIDRFLNDESGATATEYALLVALIAAVIIGGATVLGTSVNGELNSIASTVTTAGG
jgi:pilus assembly protein Flp/PilA